MVDNTNSYDPIVVLSPTIIPSPYDFNTTLLKLKTAITDKGMDIFAIIDHKAQAQMAGFEMQPTIVLIFGNPKAGTPLMQKDPIFALRLPLKVLITQQNDQVVVAMDKAESLVLGTTLGFDDVKDSLKKAEGLISNILDSDIQ